MKKRLIYLSFLVVLLAASLVVSSSSYAAASSSWSQLTSWFKSKPAQPKPATESAPVTAPIPAELELTPAMTEPSKPASKQTDLAEFVSQVTVTEPAIPAKSTPMSAENAGQPAKFIPAETTPKSSNKLTIPEAPAAKNSSQATPAAVQNSDEAAPAIASKNTNQPSIEPRWSLNTLPPVAIRQKDYNDINLNDYVTSKVNQDHFIYLLTPGKNNPQWVSVQADGILHIASNKISPEDVDTTQIIYLMATSSRSGKVGTVEMTIKITTNDQLAAPVFQRDFSLPDAVPKQNYFVNLADAVNTTALEDNDELTFQLINSSATWLQMGENGFSLNTQKVPENAADKYFEVILRVSSKMSGKSNDFNGRIYVNPIPLPLQWQPAPAAAINKNYSLDLTQYISSNIKNDRFNFHIDTATLPHWLTIQNNRILSGIPQEAELLDHPQQVQVIAKSLVTGLTGKTTLVIPVRPDQQLIPQWKNNFFSNPIIGEAYRSDDLMTVLENRYPHDELSFEYISGPDWLGFNSMCHCLASKGLVPDNAAGQTVTIKLRVHSKASGQAVDYAQSVMVYTGVPQWTQTNLPDVQIAQSSNNIEIPLSNYTQDDISGDIFTYQLDHFHSPRWISIGKKSEQYYLLIDPNKISINEVGTTQTVRILATSQSTRKSSVQLLTINVKANPTLPKPAWKNTSLAMFTVGVEHVVDLAQYIQAGLAGDRLTIKLGSDSPNWLSIKDNRLTGIPPRDQIGGPYPVNFVVYSQATNTNTVITTQISVQLAVVADDNMEIHPFYDNHQSIVIRGLQKNRSYRLYAVKGSHFDYGPFYSPHAIKTAEDWNGNPFYAVNSDQTVTTGDDGVVSIVYYTLPTSSAPQFESLILR